MEITMWPIRLATLAILASAAALLPPAKADAASRTFDAVGLKFDKTKEAAARSVTPADAAIQQLLGKRFVNLDIEVLIDGSDADAVQTSIEASDRRYPAKCAPGVLGSQIMSPDIEYFFTSVDQAGKQVRVSVYPGSRTDFPFNKVTCLPGPRADTAIFKVQGYYLVDQDDLGTAIELELRAIAAPAE
jgi:hypothetical protein